MQDCLRPRDRGSDRPTPPHSGKAISHSRPVLADENWYIGSTTIDARGRDRGAIHSSHPAYRRSAVYSPNAGQLKHPASFARKPPPDFGARATPSRGTGRAGAGLCLLGLGRRSIVAYRCWLDVPGLIPARYRTVLILRGLARCAPHGAIWSSANLAEQRPSPRAGLRTKRSQSSRAQLRARF